jgi:hypothetical protein
MVIKMKNLLIGLYHFAENYPNDHLQKRAQALSEAVTALNTKCMTIFHCIPPPNCAIIHMTTFT